MAARNKTPINNEILARLVTDFNIAPAQVAKKIGTTEARVNSWIDGADYPNYMQAEKLAYEVLIFN